MEAYTHKIYVHTCRSDTVRQTVAFHQVLEVYILAGLTLHVRLKPSVVCLVHDAAAVARLGHRRSLPTRVVVEDVEDRDEELVRVLLLVASQVAGVGPDQMEQLERDVWARDP